MTRYLVLVFEAEDDDIPDADMLAAGEEAARWVDFPEEAGACFYTEVRLLHTAGLSGPFRLPS